MKVRLVVPFAWACMAVAGLASAAPAIEGSFERTLKVTGAVSLDIRTGSGDIRVHPGPAGSVRVVGRIRANSWITTGNVEQRVKQIEQSPPIDQQGNEVRIGYFKDESLQRNVSISYDVTVPADTTLTSRTGSGDQAIGDLQGPVEAHTGSGDITIGRVGGAVDVSSGSGDVSVGAAAGLKADSGSGEIRADAVAGPAYARSGSGDITIGQTANGNVDVSAASGDVEVTGVQGAARVHCSSGSITIDGRPTGPWSIDSSSGGVSLRLPADAAFDLDARASSGSIESDHPVTMTGRIDRHRLAGKVRGGGPLVTISTASGNIRVR